MQSLRRFLNVGLLLLSIVDAIVLKSIFFVRRLTWQVFSIALTNVPSLLAKTG